MEELNARLDKAEARLTALQVEVAEAVTAHEEARQQLTYAEDAARLAAVQLGAARAAHESADDAVAGEAALLYMQGGSLQNLAFLLLSPPNTMSDLSWVLDDGARRAQEGLDAATAAQWEATAREEELSAARRDREAAAAAARSSREAAQAKAEKASAEAARLGAEQEKLTARLDVLQQGADDLATQRAAAAGADLSMLLGVQDGTVGPGPRAAQEIARTAMPDFGWGQDAEFACLVTLWHSESGWSWSATNRSSGAYGIPQSLPGWKMASAGSDWLTNPATQIAWGMDYIRTTYGSPCDALAAFTARSPHWY